MNGLHIWTDVALRPSAKAHLAAAGAIVVESLEGSVTLPADTEGAIVGSRLRGDAKFFQSAPALRALARVGIGYDRIDLGAASAAGVCVMNTPAAPTESTAEFAVLLVLAASRRLLPGANSLRQGIWTQSSDLQGNDLTGRTLGLVGCGRIGRRVAEIAAAFGMRVIAYDPLAPELPTAVTRLDSLAALLAASDIVSLHAPLGSSTQRLLGAREFSLMRKGALLVNTARGGLVDEAALHAALESGQIGAAALDVWEPEPPASDHPLLRHPRVIATPHMAAFTTEGRDRSHLGAAQQVVQALRGERPAHLLNPEAWETVAAAAKVRR